MLEKRTLLNQIEITSEGVIQARFAKQVVENDAVFASEWHRTAFMPNCNIAAQLEFVSEHLSEMGYPPVSESDAERIRRIATAAWEGIEPVVQPVES